MKCLNLILGFLVITLSFSLNAQVADVVTNDDGVVTVQKFYDDGTLKETGTFRNKVPSGNWVQYYPDGSIHMEAFYKDGQKDGKWFVWTEDGKFLYEMVYADNKMLDTHQWRIEQRNMLAGK